MKLLISGLMILALAGCGSGGGDSRGEQLPSNNSGRNNSGSGWLRIEEPTANGSFETDSTRVSLSGRSFGPPAPLFYMIDWTNASTGETGQGHSHRCDHYCTDFEWSADDIPLAMGANSITVEATDDGGNVGRETIIVTRIVDTTPPTIWTVTPADGSYINLQYGSLYSGFFIDVEFTELISVETINTATFFLTTAAGQPVPATITVNTKSAQLKPSDLLAPGTYQITVTTGVRDASGIALAAPFISSFNLN